MSTAKQPQQNYRSHHPTNTKTNSTKPAPQEELDDDGQPVRGETSEGNADTSTNTKPGQVGTRENNVEDVNGQG